MDFDLPRTITEHLPVTVRWNRALHEGMSRHLSARGISVVLEEPIPAGQTLAAWIQDEAVADYPSDGMVQWVRKLPNWTRTGGTWEIGVRFLMWSDPYFRFLERFIRDHVERRKFQRYEDELKVVLGTDRLHTEEVTRNISRGGMLVETKRPIEMGEEILIGLTVPDMLDQVQIWGEIVHVRPKGPDGSYEAAVRIVAFDHDDGSTYHQYVDYLRELYALDERPEMPTL